MAIPEVTFTIEPVVTAPEHHVDDVILVAGLPGGGGTGTEGEVYKGASLEELVGRVGNTGDTAEFLEALFARVTPQVFFAPYSLQKADNSNKSDAEVETAIKNALNFSRRVSPRPTILHSAGDVTAKANATAGNSIVTHMETLSETLKCKAIANSAQDTIENAETWGQNNGQPNVLGIFNQREKSDGTFVMPAGYWLGAALEITSEHGRAWGVNYAEVKGVEKLRHDLTPISGQLVGLDAVGVSSIVSDEGAEEIIGDEFKTATETPLRFWTIGRVVDHVQRVIGQHAHNFIGPTYTADRIATHLTRALNPIIEAKELISGSITPDPEQTQGLTKYFVTDIELLYATNKIAIKMRFAI